MILQLFVLVLALTSTVAEPIQAICQFDSAFFTTATGSITFSQSAESQPVDISVNVQSTRGVSVHIHTYSVLNGACGSTSGHYWPNCTVNCSSSTDVGELTNKHGNLSTMIANSPLSDPNVKLSGATSVAGRSIVIHDGTGARIACCTIQLVSGRSDKDLVAYEAPRTIIYGDAGGDVDNLNTPILLGYSASTISGYPA